MMHLGDITKINGAAILPVDCICGGSPCQDLSVAGKRAGLAGERSGLYMEQIRIIREMREADVLRGRTGVFVRPRYMVWENVPGAFSSNKGRDFAAVLEEAIRIVEPQAPDVPVPEKGWSKAGCLYDELGRWSVAWRVHDAQFWGVAQRRKRIALVADFGGLSAPEILFERKGMSGNFEPCSAERKAATGAVENCTGKQYGVIPLNTMVVTRYKALGERTCLGVGNEGDAQFTISAAHSHAVAYSIGGYNSKAWLDGKPDTGIYETETVRTLDAENCGYPGCNQGGTAILCLNDQGGAVMDVTENVTGTLRAQEHGHQPIVLESNQNHATITDNGIVPTLPASMGMGGGYVPMVTEPGKAAAFDYKAGAKAGSIGFTEEIAPTLYAQKQIACYDCRGGGNGNVCLTLTGDHQNRVSDYTAICIGNGQANQSISEIAGTLNTMHDQQAVITASYIPETGHTLKAKGNLQFREDSETYIAAPVVRRLTPLECERLQGYPDGWTDIGDYCDTQGKLHKSSDTVRYKAIGNSIALPFWFWLLRRISAQYERPATMGSLFDGIGGFPLCWEKCNGKGTALWASEIEEFPIAVTKYHFPEARKRNGVN